VRIWVILVIFAINRVRKKFYHDKIMREMARIAYILRYLLIHIIFEIADD